ncbi:replication initiation factor domain-containing protein [Bacillus mycoides]|uniref:replication initiation factor domain-containing protein n=1 Tax=Bacillus mycoides TaxID=1405 RepID=UPI001C024128|nr:replication initiation factor domain-containing protein [Bacillus mycoides]QWH04601.1 replication initiation factor domain-containing protein [Bacillus mycoides]
MRKNECLIDWLRFSISNTDVAFVAERVLGIQITEFASEGKGSPFPTYDSRFCFANIELHISSTHSNVLVNLSGTACRQYEEYMSQTANWHWQAFIARLLEVQASPTRIDIALDIFDDSSPHVKKIQDYVKRGQLSSRSQTFKEINSGRVLDGVLTGFTLYIGTHPQMLRIYDKKQEIRDNTGEVLNLNKWVRWELELGDKKAQQACEHIAKGTPLNAVIRGILASHYSFKTQPKGANKNFHNKARWNNMRWWDDFINDIPKIPLRVTKEKPTMKEKKHWIEKSTTKSRAMVYETYKLAYGQSYADAYLREELEIGKSKFTEIDKSMIEQSINELLGEKEI